MTAPSATYPTPDNDTFPMTDLERGLEKLRGWHARRDGVPYSATESALWRDGWLLRRDGHPGERHTPSHDIATGPQAEGYAAC